MVVDDYFRTTVPSIFAVGDIIDRYQLTPVALAEGMVVSKTPSATRRVRSITSTSRPPCSVRPPVGTVGLMEYEAREKYGDVLIFKSSFRTLKHTPDGQRWYSQTFMKMIVDKASDRVVGLHMVGPDTGEMTQGFAVALKAGATKAVFDSTIGIHPTSAEEFVTMREPVRRGGEGGRSRRNTSLRGLTRQSRCDAGDARIKSAHDVMGGCCHRGGLLAP